MISHCMEDASHLVDFVCTKREHKMICDLARLFLESEGVFGFGTAVTFIQDQYPDITEREMFYGQHQYGKLNENQSDLEKTKILHISTAMAMMNCIVHGPNQYPRWGERIMYQLVDGDITVLPLTNTTTITDAEKDFTYIGFQKSAQLIEDLSKPTYNPVRTPDAVSRWPHSDPYTNRATDI